MAEHLARAQRLLRGWTLHSAFQFVSGKRFLAALESSDDPEVRVSWALARIIAKELAGRNDWSGSGLPTDTDLKRYKQLAAKLSEKTT